MPSVRTFRAVTSTLLTSLTLAAGLQLAACGPTVFEDATTLTVVGDPPPPPPKPKVVIAKPKRVEVQDNRIVINEKIQFDFNKATIKPESDSLMEEIIKVLKDAPHIKKVAIEGHTSGEGKDKYNLKLSDQRAKAVMDYLVSKGALPKEMFTAKGFGETKMIADESTEEGKEKNRRVEFNITAQDVTEKKVAIDPKSGEKTVLEEKVDREEKTDPADPAAAAAPAAAPAK